MNDHASKAALHIAAGDIAGVAKAGVERALAARQAGNLTPAEIEAVSGGAALSLALKYDLLTGGRPFAVYDGALNVQTLPAAQDLAGFSGRAL